MTSPIPFIASVPITAGIMVGVGRLVRKGRGKILTSRVYRVAWGENSGSNAKKATFGSPFLCLLECDGWVTAEFCGSELARDGGLNESIHKGGTLNGRDRRNGYVHR
ncbi:hypothetical protein D3C78_1698000 [compost metagenome]